MKINTMMDVAMPSSTLFQLMQDYNIRKDWDPLTRHVVFLNTHRTAKGTILRYTANNGMTMDTEYVTYKPGKIAAFKMIRGPAIFEQFAGSWQYETLAPNLTRLKIRYTIKAKSRCLAWLLTPLTVTVFRFETWRRMRALKSYAESSMGLCRAS